MSHAVVAMSGTISNGNANNPCCRSREPGLMACPWRYRFARAAAWEVYPDVRPALARLRRSGLRLAVIANWDARLPELLGALGLGENFETIVTSQGAGVQKPHPLIFQTALSLLQLFLKVGTPVFPFELLELQMVKVCEVIHYTTVGTPDLLAFLYMSLRFWYMVRNFHAVVIVPGA